MPRLTLGSDDEFVVKMAWGGREEAESTWKPVWCVVDGAPAVLRKRSQGAAAEGGAKAGVRTAVWTAFLIILWFGESLGF